MQDNHHELMEFTERLTDAEITWAIRCLDPESYAGKSICRDEVGEPSHAGKL